jgi:tetratricopeptide (TPR) repeat protein
MQIKCLYGFIIILAIVFSASAQENDVMLALYDKLKITTNDTAKLTALKDIVENESNEAKAASYNTEALAICFQLLKSGNQKIQQKALMALPLFVNNNGYFAETQDNYALAFEGYFKAQELAKRLNNQKVLGQTYNNIGYTLNFTNKHTLAKSYFDSALIVYEATKDYEEMAYTINNLLSSFEENESLHEQLRLIRKGLAYKLKTGNEIGLANMYNNLGVIQLGLKQYDSLLLTHAKAIEVARQNETLEPEIMAYFHLAKYYKEVKQFDVALVNLLKSYHLSSTQKLGQFSAKAALELKNLYTEIGKKEEALKYEKEVEIAKNFLKSQNEKRNFNIELEKFYTIKSNYADSVLALVKGEKIADQNQESSSNFKWLVVLFSLGTILLIWFLIKQKKSASSMD